MPDETSLAADRGWQMGAVAKMLTAPLSTYAAAILNSRELEFEFLGACWERQHALLAVLDKVAGRPDFDLSVPRLREDFQRRKAVELVRGWYGLEPCGLAGVFNKLGGKRAKEPGAYRELVSMLALGGLGAKTLRHLPHIEFRDISRLAALPDWLRSEEMRWVEPHAARQLAAIAEAVVGQGACSPDDLRGLLSGGDFASSPLLALSRCGIVFSFPEPPFPSTDRLRWVEDTEKLEEVGRTFRNCARDFAEACLAGTTHLYVWEGRELGLAAVGLMGPSWVCKEVRGPRNALLSAAEEEAVRAAMPLSDVNRRLWKGRLRACQV